MSGKSYSIREMKTIVEYLTTNKLYGEIKGRKMWMDFANTEVTNRSWQSLKETFLKRILPDIHNPYYKLTMEQINSFRSGYDVNDRNKTRLEIHTVSDDSNGPTENNTTQSSNGNGINIKEENIPGEDKKCSKVPMQSRSSADTVIVDTCYETAEDIQKDLESPTGDKENNGTKSLRDCITYSEPLTPMLQEVLDDFQSEPENEPEASEPENPMEIVHSVPDSENIENINEEVSKIINQTNQSKDAVNSQKATIANSAITSGEKKSDMEGKDSQSNVEHTKELLNPGDNTEKDSEVICLDDSPSDETKNSTCANKMSTDATQETTKNVVTEIDKTPDAIDSQLNTSNSQTITPAALNNSNNTPDASLPNNPEALKKRSSNDRQNEKSLTPEKTSETNTIRKRSNSENVKIIENKKKKLDMKKTKADSESESKRATDRIVKGKFKSVETKSKQMDVDNIPKNKKDTEPVKKGQTLADSKIIPSTSATNDCDKVDLVLDSEQDNIINDSSNIKNPCLENVSLYDGEVNKSKYCTSESDNEANNRVHKDKNVQNKQNKEEINNTQGKEANKGGDDAGKKKIDKNISSNQNVDKNKLEKQSDVVEDLNSQKLNEEILLKSETETEECSTPPRKKQKPGKSSKVDRDKLANVFGFSSGAVSLKRKRQLSRRRRTISQNVSHKNGVTDSSGWTSESDSVMYISPPHSRRNRQSKKYLKPHSGRILSLEEEGGLFVMYHNKIYPIVKNGKLVKKYTTYLPESESEEERDFWKNKYIEEKKKAHELEKLLEKAKESKVSSTPAVAPPNPLSPSTSGDKCESTNAAGHEMPNNVPQHKANEEMKNENIKLKLSKNDKKMELEGNWAQIQLVLGSVVQYMEKTEAIHETKMRVEPPSSSGISTPIVITPVDPETREKVDKMEQEIFKEIEERDMTMADENDVSHEDVEESNVTKRKPGRPPKANATPKTSGQSDSKETEETSVSQHTPPEPKIDPPKRQTRTPRRLVNETSTTEVKKVQTRRSKLNTSDITKDNEEEDIRYMLPPRSKRQSIKSATDKKTSDKPQRSTAQAPKIFSSPETVCPNSLDSTQGYQDSDPSPMKVDLRKKKGMNVIALNSKTKSHMRRSLRNRPQPYLYCDDSNNASFDVPMQKVERDNSTLNTEVYRSESYQLLMSQPKNLLRQLDPIDETCPIGNGTIKHLDSTATHEVFSVQMNNIRSLHSGQHSSDIGSSSNVSLPPSPELSLVENMSISKNVLDAYDAAPTINEMQCTDIGLMTSCKQFLISDVDISMPLMQAKCGFESSNIPTEYNPKTSKNLIIEPLLNKISTFNIADQTNLTDTLDKKLQALLLESAKKIAAQSQSENMDVDNTDVPSQKKTKRKKRCSTPRKRNSLKSKKIPKIQPVIEEECVELYSKGGRKSCPPILQTLICDDNAITDEINIVDLTIDENAKSKGVKRKKDIIKVKILRPKSKKPRSNTTTAVQEKNSICTDSGINDTESGVFLPIDGSVDLIHNHSETCLLANECVGDSIEFVENSMRSILTLSDSMQSGDNIFDDAEDILPDIYCNNAQDVRTFHKSKPNEVEIEDGETVYHSPIGTEMSSLITEDLSDDLPQSQVATDKWYLLSEEETTKTNMAQGTSTANISSFGANLKQIFPLTCAVPDLSTITELSRENGDSRKPTLEGASGDGFNSQNIFDSNF